MVFKKEGMKILIFSLFLLPFSFLFSQGNLQFNAVKRVTNSATVVYGGIVSVGSITVPADKVWKIESGSIINTQLATNTFLFIDNQILWSLSGANNQILYSPPIWLPAGTYSIGLQNSTGGTQSFTTKISAVEFNIIP